MAKNAGTEVAGIWSGVTPIPGVKAEPAIPERNGLESASVMTGILDPNRTNAVSNTVPYFSSSNNPFASFSSGECFPRPEVRRMAGFRRPVRFSLTQPTAGYRLQHANDRHDPRRLRPRERPEPRNVTVGKHRTLPTSGGPETGKTTAVASSARPRVLDLSFPPVATLEGQACHRQAGDSRRLAPPGIPQAMSN